METDVLDLSPSLLIVSALGSTLCYSQNVRVVTRTDTSIITVLGSQGDANVSQMTQDSRD